LLPLLPTTPKDLSKPFFSALSHLPPECRVIIASRLNMQFCEPKDRPEKVLSFGQGLDLYDAYLGLLKECQKDAEEGAGSGEAETDSPSGVGSPAPPPFHTCSVDPLAGVEAHTLDGMAAIVCDTAHKMQAVVRQNRDPPKALIGQLGFMFLLPFLYTDQQVLRVI
ncbi:hypothetical protein KIPB_016023, partial [Kipferlia bialata]